jgi:predicted CXXCH cytochrome family protein
LKKHIQRLFAGIGLVQKYRGLALTVAVGVACAIAISCITTGKVSAVVETVPGATYAGNETCGECHEAESKKFMATAHARIQLAGSEEVGESGCEACHGPGSAHVDAGGGKGTIYNPGKSPDACYKCHTEQKAQFSLPYHHPVNEGKMTCADCHDPHGADAKKSSKIAMSRVETRIHAFKHEALSEGCAACHDVHGSVNKKMLTETTFALCLKCHAEVQADDGDIQIGSRSHSSYVTRGKCWNAGCHTAVHGSNVDVHLRY